MSKKSNILEATMHCINCHTYSGHIDPEESHSKSSAIYTIARDAARQHALDTVRKLGQPSEEKLFEGCLDCQKKGYTEKYISREVSKLSLIQD